MAGTRRYDTINRFPKFQLFEADQKRKRHKLTWFNLRLLLTGTSAMGGTVFSYKTKELGRANWK